MARAARPACTRPAVRSGSSAARRVGPARVRWTWTTRCRCRRTWRAAGSRTDFWTHGEGGAAVTVVYRNTRTGRVVHMAEPLPSMERSRRWERVEDDAPAEKEEAERLTPWSEPS